MSMPALLSPGNQQRFEAPPLRQALAFAFATGDSAGSLDRELCKPRFGPHTWSSTHFGPGLFLNELVREHFLHNEPSRDWAAAYLVRCLSSAPTDLETIQWRQSSLKELLEDPSLSTAAEDACASR